MLLWRKLGSTSNILRVVLRRADTGLVLTGLTSSSSGLIISTIADNEASATAYTQAGGTIETISALGTFAAPTATKCRFKEVDATNHPGLYEIQLADARYVVSNSKYLIVSFSGVSNLLTEHVLITLGTVDPYNSVPIDWGQVNNATATVTLSNTTIKNAVDVLADTSNIKTRLPAELTGAGNMKADALLLNGATPNNLAAGAQMDLVDAPNSTALAAIASQVRTELATELAHIDADISSRAASSDLSDVAGDVLDALDDLTDVQARIPAALVSGRIDAYAGASSSSVRDDFATSLLDLAAALDSKTVRQVLRVLFAASAGKRSGLGTDTETFKGPDGSTTRLVMEYSDDDGNTESVSYP